MSEEVKTESDVQPSPTVKEAEVKLKEMSRKAKERSDSTRHRGAANAPRRSPQRQSGSNLRLVLIGVLGIGALGILYLMLRGNEVPSPQKPVQPSVLSPKKDENKAPSPKGFKTEFEINSF